MDLTWDCAVRAKDESEEIESIETTEEGVVEMGEMERSLAAQEMICGVMISKSKCHTGSHNVIPSNNHNASVTPHVKRDNTIFRD